MAITITLAGTDLTSQISPAGYNAGLQVQQIIGAQRDTATIIYRKFGDRTYVPTMFDSVLVEDGDQAIFGGRVVNITETPITPADGVEYQIDCADYSIDLDAELVSQQYDNMTVEDIIADMLANFSTGFTGHSVSCGFTVTTIIFNQVPISQALKRLADLVQYNWYVDPAKDVHFFPKYQELAPLNLTDTSGNYLNGTLQTLQDGTQLANSVKVRGGSYISAAPFGDSITVVGNDTKSFKLPYQFNGLSITVNGVTKTVGADFLDSFDDYDVLYNFQQWTILFENNLSNGDVIAFSGNPYIPMLAVASDAASIALYGTREKIIEDLSISDIDTARQRAIIELAAYKNPMGTATFDTLTSGLHVGQTITIDSALRGVTDDFIIRQATFAYYSPTSFKYSIQAVTVRSFTLIDLLQQLLMPTNTPIDPNEVSEIIKTDLSEITFTETITLHETPDHTDAATVSIAEVVAHDPLGTAIAPTWVLGPYVPSGTGDPKRVINLDHASAALY